MRYVYNCVKLVLLIACLGFAGQTSAAKPIELGGLLFDMSRGQLQVSATDGCKKFIKESVITKPTNGAFVNICDFFSIYFESGFALDQVKPAENGKTYSKVCKPKDGLLKDLLIWSADCNKGSVHEIYDDIEDAYKIVEVQFTHHRISNAISKLFTAGRDNSSVKFNIKFTKSEKDGVMVFVNKTQQMKLANWIETALSDSKARGKCLCRHEYDDIDDAYTKLPVFVDLSKLTNVLAPVVDALQNATNNDGEQKHEEDTGEDFGGFGDLF